MPKIPPAPCTDCGRMMRRTASSRPTPTCHPCRRAAKAARDHERQEHEAGRATRPCKDCGEPFYRWDTYETSGTHRVRCKTCYLARIRRRQKPKRPRPQRSCRLCARLFGPSRNWYCSEFCRATATRIPEDLRFLLRTDLLAELASTSPPCGPTPRRTPPTTVTVTQWRLRPGAHEGGDARYLAGPPPHPIELRVSVDGAATCPSCLTTMAADDATWECYRCDLTAWKPSSTLRR